MLMSFYGDTTLAKEFLPVAFLAESKSKERETKT